MYSAWSTQRASPVYGACAAADGAWVLERKANILYMWQVLMALRISNLHGVT